MWVVDDTLVSSGPSKMHPQTLSSNSIVCSELLAGRVRPVPEIGAVAPMYFLSIAIPFGMRARLHLGHGTI